MLEGGQTQKLPKSTLKNHNTCQIRARPVSQQKWDAMMIHRSMLVLLMLHSRNKKHEYESNCIEATASPPSVTNEEQKRSVNKPTKIIFTICWKFYLLMFQGNFFSILTTVLALEVVVLMIFLIRKRRRRDNCSFWRLLSLELQCQPATEAMLLSKKIMN